MVVLVCRVSLEANPTVTNLANDRFGEVGPRQPMLKESYVRLSREKGRQPWCRHVRPP